MKMALHVQMSENREVRSDAHRTVGHMDHVLFTSAEKDREIARLHADCAAAKITIGKLEQHAAQREAAAASRIAGLERDLEVMRCVYLTKYE